MQRSRLYHLILLASAVAVLVVGSLVRSRMLRTDPRASGEARSPESTLVREIQQLRRAFTRNEAAALRDATRTISMLEMPWIVSIAPELRAEPTVLRSLLRDDLPVGMDTPEEDAMSLAMCSGVVLEGGRRILTTANVAEWGTRLTVSSEGIRPVAARLVGIDKQTHLALLAIDQRLSTPLPSPGDPRTEIRLGDRVFVLGRAQRKSRNLGLATISQSSVSPGNGELFLLDSHATYEQDGGLVVDSTGQALAICLRMEEAYPGRGAAVPIETALEAAKKLESLGDPAGQWGYIGIAVQDVDDALKEYFSVDSGALVADVAPQGPAEQVGLSPGDLISAAGGVPVSSAAQLLGVVRRAAIGSTIVLSVKRRRASFRSLDLSVVVGSPEAAPQKPPPDARSAEGTNASFQIRTAPAGTAIHLLSLQPGDLITAIDNAPVNAATLKLLAAGLRGGERLWLIRVERRGAAFYLATKGLETVR